ncbi:MAG: hypothetical protein HQL58_12880 [Magnetococcales bacterium]|nr:hypothetical protein [Magnetococcales bacterium]
MEDWLDFNSADCQKQLALIPHGTIAPVRLHIRPGGYDDDSRGWNGGYASCSRNGGSIFLSCEFVVIDGPYAQRKVWSSIGLHSDKGPEWANQGRSFIRAILNSARGFSDRDLSAAAMNARRINAMADLDRIEFIAKIEIELDGQQKQRNVIKRAITLDHQEYAPWSSKLFMDVPF